MPVDARIPLAQYQPRDPMVNALRAEQVGMLHEQKGLRAARIQALKAHPGDWQAVENQLRQAGDMEGAMSVSKFRTTGRTAAAQASAAEIENARALFDRGVQMLSTVNSQAELDKVRLFAKARLGPQVFEMLPDQYSPEAIDQAMRSSMSIKDQLDAMSRDAQLAETGRHNRATEGNQPPVEVGDETSPTGTRYLSRADAIGQPGKPSSGLLVETTDEGTRIVQGRGAGAKQTSKFGETEGKLRAEDFRDMRKLADSARGVTFRVKRTINLLKQAETGKFAGVKLFGKQLAKAMGVDFDWAGIKDDVDALEALRSLGTQFAIDFIQGTKGAVSDREMGLFMNASPGLQNTNEGNLLILDTAREVANRQIEVKQLASKYVRQHGRLDAGFDEVLEKYYEKNPFYTTALEERIKAATGGGPAGTIRIDKPLSEYTPAELIELKRQQAGG